MKAITEKHPWAYAIAHLGKSIENRTWKPYPSQLKPGDWLAIHGGAEPKGRNREEFDRDLDSIICMDGNTHLDFVDPREFITPGIVAVCKFGGVVTESDSPWFNGPIGWRLVNVVALPEPVRCKGSQGLWDLPDDVLTVVRSGYLSAVAEMRK